MLEKLTTEARNPASEALDSLKSQLYAVLTIEAVDLVLPHRDIRTLEPVSATQPSAVK